MVPVTVGKVEFDQDGFRLEGDVLKAAYQAWCDDLTSSFNKKAS